jgi:hypothetical protein
MDTGLGRALRSRPARDPRCATAMRGGCLASCRRVGGAGIVYPVRRRNQPAQAHAIQRDSRKLLGKCGWERTPLSMAQACQAGGQIEAPREVADLPRGFSLGAWLAVAGFGPVRGGRGHSFGHSEIGRPDSLAGHSRDRSIHSRRACAARSAPSRSASRRCSSPTAPRARRPGGPIRRRRPGSSRPSRRAPATRISGATSARPRTRSRRSRKKWCG